MDLIKSKLFDLKNEIYNIAEKEIEIDQPNQIKDFVEKILDFNKQNQSGQGPKMLTPNQMLSRFPITLVQPGNNSQKLKNEIRQL